MQIIWIGSFLFTMLIMLLIRLRKRFYEMMHTYIGTKVSWYNVCFYSIDYVFSLIIDGASISDYFAYGFYKLRRNGRKEYITFKRYHKIQNICNPIKGNREICRNKVKFNNRFKDFLGRDWLDVTNSSYEDFYSFILKHDIVFIKETLGFRGIGTTKYETEKIEDIKTLYNELHNDKNAHYVAEEKITQIDSLSEFHPWSVNTIRIVTVYNDVTDEVHFMNARLRMGNKKNSVDNFHFDGIGANINIESGIIDSVGYDVHNQTYIVHPETGKQIIGFKIPYWNECKKFAEKAARNIPEVRYIGWDIVIKENGEFLLIEGNDNADHDFQQLYNKGLWKDYKLILNNIKK